MPEAPSCFDGGDGEDLIIAEHDLKGTPYQGYAINLQKNEVRYIGINRKEDVLPFPANLKEIDQIIRLKNKESLWPLLANLKEIEHIHGHTKTPDYLVGNEKNNILNGLGGRDEIWGHEGNDTLILEQGIASGGPGIDHTIILKNTQPHPVNVSLHDDGEEALSLITFQHRYSEIKDFTLHLNEHGQYDLQMLLKSEERQATTVIIKNAYQFEGQRKTNCCQAVPIFSIHRMASPYLPNFQR
nr:hypothetical protein [Candidatus Hamiltonella defensa]